jgi:hypothetical protein
MTKTKPNNKLKHEKKEFFSRPLPGLAPPQAGLSYRGIKVIQAPRTKFPAYRQAGNIQIITNHQISMTKQIVQ